MLDTINSATDSNDPGNVYDIIETPEPSTLLLLATGLAMLGGMVMRKRFAGGQA